MRVSLVGDRSWEVVDGYRQIAAASTHFGAYANARAAYRQSITIAELLGGKDHPAVAEGLAGLAEVALQLGDERQAIELITREKAIVETRAKTDAGRLAECRNRLGRAHHQLQRDDLAAAEFRAAIDLWEHVKPFDVGSLASGWQNLGGALADLGLYEQAEEALRKAISFREQVTPSDPDELASGLNALGSLRYQKADYAGALEAHLRAWEIQSGRPSISGTAQGRDTAQYRHGPLRIATMVRSG